MNPTPIQVPTLPVFMTYDPVAVSARLRPPQKPSSDFRVLERFVVIAKTRVTSLHTCGSSSQTQESICTGIVGEENALKCLETAKKVQHASSLVKKGSPSRFRRRSRALVQEESPSGRSSGCFSSSKAPAWKPSFF